MGFSEDMGKVGATLKAIAWVLVSLIVGNPNMTLALNCV